MHKSVHESFNLISEIPVGDWERFEVGLSYKKFGAGENFLDENQISDKIAFVATGMFRLFHRTQKKEINYNFFGEGQFAVDYESFLKKQRSSFVIQALEDSEVYIFSRAHIEQQYRLSHAWEKFGRLVAEGVFIKSRERIKALMFLSAEQRYLEFIKEYRKLHKRVPLYHIASFLGVDPTSLSRIRRKIAGKRS